MLFFNIIVIHKSPAFSVHSTFLYNFNLLLQRMTYGLVLVNFKDVSATSCPESVKLYKFWLNLFFSQLIHLSFWEVSRIHFNRHTLVFHQSTKLSRSLTLIDNFRFIEVTSMIWGGKRGQSTDTVYFDKC